MATGTTTSENEQVQEVRNDVPVVCRNLCYDSGNSASCICFPSESRELVSNLSIKARFCAMNPPCASYAWLITCIYRTPAQQLQQYGHVGKLLWPCVRSTPLSCCLFSISSSGGQAPRQLLKRQAINRWNSMNGSPGWMQGKSSVILMISTLFWREIPRSWARVTTMHRVPKTYTMGMIQERTRSDLKRALSHRWWESASCVGKDDSHGEGQSRGPAGC